MISSLFINIYFYSKLPGCETMIKKKCNRNREKVIGPPLLDVGNCGYEEAG